MARAIAILIDPESTASVAMLSPAQRIEERVVHYSMDMSIKNTFSQPRSGGAVVFLTGSTGNIGSQILATLLEDSGVSRVYAFNRGQSSEESTRRQAIKFHGCGFSVDLLSSAKYVPLIGDLNEEYFGLSHAIYNDVRPLQSY